MSAQGGVHLTQEDWLGRARHRHHPYYSLRRTATIERRERGAYPWTMFDPFNLGVPTLRVDTTCGYVPGLDAVIAFCRVYHSFLKGRREAGSRATLSS